MRALFIGLSTLDVIQQVDQVPGPDDKVAALRLEIAAGGPAANAAVAHAVLSNRLRTPGETTLITRIGQDPVGELVLSDLQKCGVRVQNYPLEDQRTPIANIMVTKGTGQRAVVSATDGGRSQDLTEDPAISALLAELQPAVVLADSYEVDLSIPLLRAARTAGIPTIMDAGTKKPQTQRLLPHVSIAVVSERYLHGQPDDSPAAICAELLAAGVDWTIVTCGAGPIIYQGCEMAAPASHPVTEVPAVVDTLGAGDFFHGALAHAVGGMGFTAATAADCLTFAATVAGRSVQSFGSRAWLSDV